MDLDGKEKSVKGNRLPLWAWALAAVAIVSIVAGAIYVAMLISTSSSQPSHLNQQQYGNNPEGTLPTACIAQSGFLCKINSFSNGDLNLTIGQATGQNWNSTYFAFINITDVANGDGINSSYYTTTPKCNLEGSTDIPSGTTCTVIIPIYGVSTRAGTMISGQIWGEYYTGNTLTPYYTEIAVISAREK